MTQHKRLGQHFFVNNDVLQKIADAIEVKNNDLIVEIGAGHGELTEEILNTAQKIKLIAVL